MRETLSEACETAHRAVDKQTLLAIVVAMFGCWAHLGGVDLRAWGWRVFDNGRWAVGRLRPVVSRAAPVAIVILMATSTFVGVVVVGTAPISDTEHSGIVTAAQESSRNVYIDGGNEIKSLDNSGNTDWTTSVDSSVSSLASSHDMVFALLQGGRVLALDANDGSIMWNNSYANVGYGDLEYLTEKGSLMVGSDEKYLLDADNGDVIWNREVGSRFNAVGSSPDQESVYGTDGSGDVYSLDTTTGDTVWTGSVSDLDGYGLGVSPTTGTIFVGDQYGDVHALYPSNGSIKWDVSPGFNNAQSIVAAPDGNSIYVGGYDGLLYELDATDGTTIQQSSPHSSPIQSLAISSDGSTVYTGPESSSKAIRTSDLSTIWTAPSGGGSVSVQKTTPTELSGLSTSNTNSSSTELFWNSSGVETTQVEYKPTDSSTWTTYSTLSGSTTTETLTGLESSTEYDVRVVADSDSSIKSTATFTTTGSDSGTVENLTIDTRALFKPNSTHPYTIYLNGEGDVTDNATLTSSNSTILSVDSTNHTLTAINDSNVSATIILNASYTAADGTQYNATKEVVVAAVTVENMEIVPGIWRFAAVADSDMLFALLIATLFAVPAARFTSAFGGLSVAQLTLVIGWLAGFVSLGMIMVSLFVTLFIGLNLAANINYEVRH